MPQKITKEIEDIIRALKPPQPKRSNTATIVLKDSFTGCKEQNRTCLEKKAY